MAELDWLENNAYTRQQNRSANLWGALVFLLIALLWGWPVFHLWQDTCYILQADANTTVEGYVERITGRRAKRGSIEAHIEYKGQNYTVRRMGQSFTNPMFEDARESRRVTVYVNRNNPSESVMSLEIPAAHWTGITLFTLAELGLLGASLYFFRFYCRNRREEKETEQDI